jgi:hypothetical protein
MSTKSVKRIRWIRAIVAMAVFIAIAFVITSIFYMWKVNHTISTNLNIYLAEVKIPLPHDHSDSVYIEIGRSVMSLSGLTGVYPNESASESGVYVLRDGNDDRAGNIFWSIDKDNRESWEYVTYFTVEKEYLVVRVQSADRVDKRRMFPPPVEEKSP